MDTVKSVKKKQLWLQSFQNTTDAQTVDMILNNTSMVEYDT